MPLTYYFSERGLIGCHPVTSGPETGGFNFHNVVVNQMSNFPQKTKRLQKKLWSSWHGKWLQYQDLEFRAARRLFPFYWNAALGIPYQTKYIDRQVGWSRHYGFSI